MHYATRPLQVALFAAALAPAACASADTVAPPPASRAMPGSVVLADDFTRPPLDRMKWRVESGLVPGGARVFVDQGRAVLVNRGHLTTLREFPPLEMGGIRVTGEWTFAGAGDDFLQVLTRSSGYPAPGSPYGETAHGIEFVAFTSLVWEHPNHMYIQGRGDALTTITDASSRGSLTLVPGRTYRFEVVDDGVAVRFTITDAADPGQSRTVAARTSYVGAASRVVFHNREACCLGRHVALLDNVRIGRLDR